jgi:hypothetical protein
MGCHLLNLHKVKHIPSRNETVNTWAPYIQVISYMKISKCASFLLLQEYNLIPEVANILNHLSSQMMKSARTRVHVCVCVCVLFNGTVDY